MYYWLILLLLLYYVMYTSSSTLLDFSIFLKIFCHISVIFYLYFMSLCLLLWTKSRQIPEYLQHVNQCLLSVGCWFKLISTHFNVLFLLILINQQLHEHDIREASLLNIIKIKLKNRLSSYRSEPLSFHASRCYNYLKILLDFMIYSFTVQCFKLF